MYKQEASVKTEKGIFKIMSIEIISCDKFLTNYYSLDFKRKKKLILFLMMKIINLTKIKRRI